MRHDSQPGQLDLLTHCISLNPVAGKLDEMDLVAADLQLRFKKISMSSIEDSVE